MKIAVASTGPTLESRVDLRFGRCPFFVVVEIEDQKIKEWKAIQNQAATAMGGAGIQAAQLVANEGVEAVICGNIGPNAFGVLSEAGIKVIAGVGDILVKEAIQRFIKKELRETQMPSTQAIPFRSPGFQAPAFGQRGRFRGPPFECVCPSCGYRMPKQRGVPCSTIPCPRCGSRMVRG